MSQKIIRRPEVETRTGLSRSTIYAMIADGTFPRPVRLGKRAVGWHENVIADWIAGRTCAHSGSMEGHSIATSDVRTTQAEGTNAPNARRSKVHPALALSPERRAPEPRRGSGNSARTKLETEGWTAERAEIVTTADASRRQGSEHVSGVREEPRLFGPKEGTPETTDAGEVQANSQNSVPIQNPTHGLAMSAGSASTEAPRSAAHLPPGDLGQVLAALGVREDMRGILFWHRREHRDELADSLEALGGISATELVGIIKSRRIHVPDLDRISRLPSLVRSPSDI